MLVNLSTTHGSAVSSEPPREEYADSLFANRVDEIEFVKSKVEQAETEKIARPLIEVYAVKGQGKSWLLQRIFNLFAFRRELSPSAGYARPPLSAHVDFSELVEKPLYFHYFAILKIIARELLRQSGRTFKIPHLDDERAPSPKELDKMADAFVEFVRSLADAFVPIMIYDTTDRAEEKVLEWLEKKIIFPLIQSDQIVFVFGGRRRLFWKFFEVRRRVDARELFPLTEEGSAEQLKLRDQDPQVGKLLFHFSKGHPEINWRILYGLQYDQGIPTLDQAVIESNHSYILDRVREIIDSQFLSALSKEAYILLWDACVLRRFHTAPLRHFAGLRDERNKKKPEGDYLDLIQQMIDAALVRWDSDKGGYVLDSTVRTVMLENLKERDSERFVKLQKDALGLYTGWVVDYPENSEHYLLEIIYHQGMCLLIGEQSHDGFWRELNEILANPKLLSTALDETALPKLLREDRELDTDVFQSFPGLREEILTRVATARETKRQA